MIRILVLIGGLITVYEGLFAQRSYVAQQTNERALYRIAQQHDSLHKVQMGLVSNYFKKNPGARKSGHSWVNGLWPTGKPKYIIEHNRRAAVASRVNELYTGGTLGETFTGRGMLVGVWENGAPLPEHMEYEGRLTVRDQADELRDHASHVMGTIIASGINSEARGIAFEARVDAYSAIGYVAEIAVAAANGLLVSNHSYGAAAGYNSSGEWLGDPDISTQEDWKFGIYNSEASVLDQIAYNAPYYLLVRSAGNERGESGAGGFPPDGPFDCMTGEAIAKNVLAVGNALKTVPVPQGPADIALSNSSSWGPSDDGRIKPDLVATGSSVLSLSSSGPDQYTTLSGTSMSSPVTAGTCILLQQMHERMYGTVMRSSTLKAILLHTTVESGLNDGPDYSHGYGFLDAGMAARTISEKDLRTKIIEYPLANGETYELEFEVTDNSSPLVVSVGWTDPEGSPVTEAVLDPTDLKLVNDLDVRVFAPDNTEFMPWILDPSIPDAPATNGDNFRDNYEKTEINNPVTGTYRIIVTHKGDLQNSSQIFSLIASNLPRTDDRQTFYWIGGNGSWNDGSHWSLSSGGAPSGIVPGTNDRVIFDNNGLSANQIVTLTNDVSVHQLKWDLDNGGGISFNNNRVQLTKALNILGTISESAGTIELLNSSGSGTHIFIEGSNTELTLVLNQPGSDCFISGENIVLDKLELAEGDLTITSDLQVNTLDLSGNSASDILLENITVSLETLDLGDPVVNNISLDNSILNFTGQNNRIVSTSASVLSDVIVLNGSLEITSGQTLNELTLTGGTSLELMDQNVLNIRSMIINATADERVRLFTETGNATINSDQNTKFCFDFVDIENISVSGTAVFAYESNSTFTGGTGWRDDQCEDVLFSIFSVTSPCAGGTTFFIDESDGQPTGWLWDFGDGNTSQEQNPTNGYTTSGTYNIVLTVSEGSFSSTSTREVIVTDSDIEIPVITEQNDRLLTNTPGQLFQWFLDGEPIDGETNRLLSLEPGSGAYQVQVTLDDCVALSDPFVITGLFGDVTGKTVFVYPNPTDNNTLFVKMSEPVGNGHLSVLDVTGKVVYAIGVELNTSGTIQIQLPEAILPGMYLLNLLDIWNDKVYRAKLLLK